MNSSTLKYTLHRVLILFVLMTGSGISISAVTESHSWSTYTSKRCDLEFQYPFTMVVSTVAETGDQACELKLQWKQPENSYAIDACTITVYRESFDEAAQRAGFKLEKGRWAVSRPEGPETLKATELLIGGYKGLRGDVGVGYSPRHGGPIASVDRVVLNDGEYHSVLVDRLYIENDLFSRIVKSFKTEKP